MSSLDHHVPYQMTSKWLQQSEGGSHQAVMKFLFEFAVVVIHHESIKSMMRPLGLGDD